MPKIKSETKNSIIYLRITNNIKNIITYQATQEGITPSEWLRKLIIKELRERNALTTAFTVPNLPNQPIDQQ